MYKGFRLLALLDLASIDLQTRFRKEKVKKKKKMRSIIQISIHPAHLVAGFCKLAVYCRGSFIHPDVNFVPEI